MTALLRNPAQAAENPYDLIIIGGGFYGAMLALEAARHGLHFLLMERADFGGATSYNSLRIIHGGFRYLQNLNLSRFFESIQERQWFLRTFPDLVKPLPCLMPLYGRGLRHPVVLGLALRLNDWLSRQRNEGVPVDRWLPNGHLLAVEQVQQYFPRVDREGLLGGAMWFDACLPHSQRLLLSVLHWACRDQSYALNYVEAVELLQDEHRVTGVLAKDLKSGAVHHFQSPVVVNAAGPWCRTLAQTCDRDVPELFRPSLAWNILFDRAALSAVALAISPKQVQAATYFLHPWQDRLLVGTVHNTWAKSVKDQPLPTEAQLAGFIQDLNHAIPGLQLQSSEVTRIYAGLLPVMTEGSTQLTDKAVIYDHGQQGGPQGLVSLSGVKLTTSRQVAAQTIQKIFPEAQPIQSFMPPAFDQHRGLVDYAWEPTGDLSSLLAELGQIVAEESVLHLDDLIFRRTNLGDRPQRAIALAPQLCELFPWDEHRSQQEQLDLAAMLNACGLRSH